MEKRKTIIIGSTGNLGRAVSKRLATQGAMLILHGRKPDKLDQLANQIRLSSPAAVAGTCVANLNNRNSFHTALLESANRAGWDKADNMVYCAGAYTTAPLTATDHTLFYEMVTANCTGPLWSIQTAAQLGIKRVIVFVCISHNKAWKNHCAYAASKSAAATIVRIAARELAPRMQINGLAPGYVDAGDVHIRKRENLVRQSPMKTRISPEEVADAVLAMLQMPFHITGQIIAVDGGLSLL